MECGNAPMRKWLAEPSSWFLLLFLAGVALLVFALLVLVA
jgi:hypothetical protein